jgi:hypothetical protein
LIPGIAVGALVLVVGFATWSRLAPHRAERRSVTSHKHALDVLGTASRRWEGVAPVRAPKPDEVARAHVQPTGALPNARRLPDDDPEPIRRAAVRLVPPSGPAPLKLPIFTDEDVGRSRPPGESATVVAEGRPDPADRRGRVPLFDHEALSPDGNVGPRRSRRRRYRAASSARRLVSVAATAVAVAAVGVAGWQLASGRTPAHHAAPPTSPAKGTSRSRSGRHGAGQGLVPTSVSGAVVSYATRKAHYTVTFAASAPCWLGVEAGVGGRYLWQTTLGAGGTASYRATGSIAVRLGAPPYVKVQVDGVKVELPAKNVQPYDITFSPSGASR